MKNEILNERVFVTTKEFCEIIRLMNQNGRKMWY